MHDDFGDIRRMKKTGHVLAVFILCCICFTAALAIDAAAVPVDTGNVEVSVSEATFPDPPMAPMAAPPPVDPLMDMRMFTVLGTWTDMLTLTAENPSNTFYIGEDPDGSASVTLIAWFAGWSNRDHALWKVEGDTAVDPDGQTSGTFSLWHTQLALTPQDNPTRAFTIKAGPDTQDANGVYDNVLQASEVTYTATVVVVKVSQLVVQEANHPGNSVTADGVERQHLYVNEALDHDADLKISATVLPNTAEARALAGWSMQRCWHTPAVHGVFEFNAAGNPVESTITISKAACGRKHTMIYAGVLPNIGTFDNTRLRYKKRTRQVKAHFVEIPIDVAITASPKWIVPGCAKNTITYRIEEADCDSAKLEVLDKNGALVYSIAAIDATEGTHAIDWNGKDSGGAALTESASPYKIKITATRGGVTSKATARNQKVEEHSMVDVLDVLDRPDGGFVSGIDGETVTPDDVTIRVRSNYEGGSESWISLSFTKVEIGKSVEMRLCKDAIDPGEDHIFYTMPYGKDYEMVTEMAEGAAMDHAGNPWDGDDDEPGLQRTHVLKFRIQEDISFPNVRVIEDYAE